MITPSDRAFRAALDSSVGLLAWSCTNLKRKVVSLKSLWSVVTCFLHVKSFFPAATTSTLGRGPSRSGGRDVESPVKTRSDGIGVVGRDGIGGSTVEVEDADSEMASFQLGFRLPRSQCQRR